MPQFILKIDLGNDAMQTKTDLLHALEQVQGDIINWDCACSGNVRNINGNVVGHYEVVD